VAATRVEFSTKIVCPQFSFRSWSQNGYRNALYSNPSAYRCFRNNSLWDIGPRWYRHFLGIIQWSFRKTMNNGNAPQKKFVPFSQQNLTTFFLFFFLDNCLLLQCHNLAMGTAVPAHNWNSVPIRVWNHRSHAGFHQAFWTNGNAVFPLLFPPNDPPVSFTLVPIVKLILCDNLLDF